MKPAYMITENALTLFNEGVPMTLHASDSRFPEALDLIRDEEWNSLRDLINVEKVLISYTANHPEISVSDAEVLYKGEAVHGYAADKLIQMAKLNLPLEPLCNFLANVLKNVSYRAQQDLLQFLEYGNMPITEDGCFLAYKRVRSDYTDMHTGKFDNSIGSVCEMERGSVDDNPNNTCSAGLHFASLDYVKDFFNQSTPLVVLKINPVDVVAIPADYHHTKGRCAKYTVFDEVDQNIKTNVLGETPVLFDEPEEVVETLVEPFAGFHFNKDVNTDMSETCEECGEAMYQDERLCPECNYPA